MAAHAGGITLNDSNCDSFSLSGPAGNQVLTCVVSNAPSGCTIQGPSTGTNGVAITLTAVCSSGSPTTYAWTGGNCANNTTQSCQAVGNNATVVYGVTPSNGIGPGNNATKSVLWSASLPVKPSGCSITPSPGSLPAGGGNVSLTAQCSGGDAVDSWNWGGATFTSTSGNTASAAITTSTTFTVSPTNGGGSSTGSITVTVGGGGGGSISCSGFLSTTNLTMNWGSWVSNANAKMGPLDATVLKFTTGPTASAGTALLYATSLVHSNHDVTLSASPCDFGTGLTSQFNGGTQRLGFSVGGTSAPILQPNSTYYFNFKNSASAVCLGGTITCDIGVLSLQKPPGT